MRSGKYGRGISHLDCRLPVWGKGMSKLRGGTSRWVMEWQGNNEDLSRWEGEGPTWAVDCPCVGRECPSLGVEFQVGLWNGNVTMKIRQSGRGKVLLGLWIAHVGGGMSKLGDGNFKLGCGMAM